jgi:hypothetical protein
MTAPLLLLCIGAALLVQVVIGLGVAMRQRSRAATTLPVTVAGPAPKGPAGAWSGFRDFRVVRREFADDAHTQCSFHLAPVDGVALPPFLPGQFITLALAVVDPAAVTPNELRTIIRCYSLSDRPEPTGYRLTIKRVLAPAGRPELPPGVASNHLHDRVHEGDILEVKAPAGRFFLDPDPSVPVVLVAGGIGITPLLSMLRWCLAEQPGRVVHLYYGVRDGGEQAFKQPLEALARLHPSFHSTFVYSVPRPDDVQGRDYQRVGYVDVDLLRSTLPIGRHQFYVCGPPPMMASLLPALSRWGVLPEDIHQEAFGSATVRSMQGGSNDPAQSVAAPLEVTFRRSGRTLAWDAKDESLLDFAERHGVAVESGCRSGSCGSCETKIVSGVVRYAHAPDHEIAPGHCLLCVGTPGSKLVLEA